MKDLRLKIRMLFFCSLIMMAIIKPCQSYSQTLSSDTLINESNKLDGKIVRFRGEVIGDIMQRGNHCWINVNDGPQALGIYCPLTIINPIRFIGNYKHTGDIIEVSGILHKACRQHGGELDIHAEELRLIQTGNRRSHPVVMPKMYLAIALFSCAGLMVWLYNYRKKNETNITSNQ